MELKVNTETLLNTICHLLHVIMFKLAEYMFYTWYVGSVIFNPFSVFIKSQFT